MVENSFVEEYRVMKANYKGLEKFESLEREF